MPAVARARIRRRTVSPAGRIVPIIVLIDYVLHRLFDVLPVVDEKVVALLPRKPASRGLVRRLGREFLGPFEGHFRSPKPGVFGDGPGVVRLRWLVGQWLHDHRDQVN